MAVRLRGCNGRRELEASWNVNKNAAFRLVSYLGLSASRPGPKIGGFTIITHRQEKWMNTCIYVCMNVIYFGLLENLNTDIRGPQAATGNWMFPFDAFSRHRTGTGKPQDTESKVFHFLGRSKNKQTRETFHFWLSCAAHKHLCFNPENPLNKSW